MDQNSEKTPYQPVQNSKKETIQFKKGVKKNTIDLSAGVVYTKKGYFLYYTAKDYDELLNEIIHDSDPQFYELFQFTKGVNLFFDVDADSFVNYEKSVDDIRSKCKLFESERQCEIIFCLVKAFDKLKFSAHIIVRIIFKNCSVVCFSLEELKSLILCIGVDASSYDAKVYKSGSGLLRTFLSTKFGQRKLLPEIDEIDPNYHFVCFHKLPVISFTEFNNMTLHLNQNNIDFLQNELPLKNQTEKSPLHLNSMNIKTENIINSDKENIIPSINKSNNNVIKENNIETETNNSLTNINIVQQFNNQNQEIENDINEIILETEHLNSNSNNLNAEQNVNLFNVFKYQVEKQLKYIFSDDSIELYEFKIPLSQTSIPTFYGNYKGLCPFTRLKHKSNNNWFNFTKFHFKFGCFSADNCSSHSKEGTYDTKAVMGQLYDLLFFNKDENKSIYESIPNEELKFLISKETDSGIIKLFEASPFYFAPTTILLMASIKNMVGNESFHFISGTNYYVVGNLKIFQYWNAAQLHDLLLQYSQENMHLKNIYLVNSSNYAKNNNITNHCSDSQTVKDLLIFLMFTVKPLCSINDSIVSHLVSLIFMNRQPSYYSLLNEVNKKELVVCDEQFFVFDPDDSVPFWKKIHLSTIQNTLISNLEKLLCNITDIALTTGVSSKILKLLKTAELKFTSLGYKRTLLSTLNNNIFSVEQLNIIENESLVFLNGIYNIETDQFRAFMPSDKDKYVTEFINYEYKHHTDIECDPVVQYLSSILPDSNLRNWFLFFLKRCLNNNTKNDVMLFLIGEGSNGKTAFLSFFFHIFSCYCSSVNSELFLANANTPNQPRPELLALRSVKIGLLSEFPNNKKVREDLFKKICGGNENFSARSLYSNKIVNFTLFTKFIIACNSLPDLPIDKAMKRRIRIINFPNKFVDNPTKPDEFKKNDNLIIQLNSKLFREAFIFYMLSVKSSSFNPDAITGIMVKPHHLEIRNNWEYILTDFFKENISVDIESETVVQISEIRDIFLDILVKKYSIALPNLTEINTFIKMYIENNLNLRYLQHRIGINVDMFTGERKYLFRKGYKGLIIKENAEVNIEV